jgi:hypothetical protein
MPSSLTLNGGSSSSAGANIEEGESLLSFDPPELRGEIAAAVESWKSLTDPRWERDFSYDIVDVADPDFDPADYKDTTITEGTKFTLSLPRWEDEVRLSYGEFIDLNKELESARLRDGRECWTDKRLLVRVSPVSEAAEQYLYRTLPEAESEDERREQLTLIEQRKRVADLRKQTRLRRLGAQLETRRTIRYSAAFSSR